MDKFNRPKNKIKPSHYCSKISNPLYFVIIFPYMEGCDQLNEII